MNREIQLLSLQVGWLFAFILVHYFNDLSWWLAFLPTIILLAFFVFAFLYGFFKALINKFSK